MRRLHLPGGAILARVAGFGKNVVALLGFGICRSRPGIGTTFADGDFKDGNFRWFRELGDGYFIFHVRSIT